MKLLAIPRDSNPYQRLLYGEMVRRGVRVRYAGLLTPSRTLNVLLLPLELAARRLAGWRVLHVHWVFGFALAGSGRSRLMRRASRAWFSLVLGVARAMGLRVAWTAHNVLPHEPVFDDDVAARRRLVGASDVVLAHSAAALGELEALGARPARGVVVPHGPFAPAPGALRPAGASAGPRTLLFFGRIAPYKGVEELLAAATALPPGIAARVVVAGECPDPALRARLVALAARAGERVELRLGRVADQDVTPLVASADAVVLPFRRVTTSGSAYLALAHGRPVIVPDMPAFADLPAEAAIAYDGSTRDLVRALAEAACRPAGDLRRAGEAARAFAHGWSWQDAAAATVAALEAPPASGPRRGAALLGAVVGDPFYRGSLELLANTVLLAAFGFVAWTLAARLYPSASIGAFSALTSAIGLLSAVAALGLPNTLIRHLAGVEHARELVAGVLGAVTAVGGVMCVAVVLLVGPHLPPALHLPRGGGLTLVLSLVVITSASAATDAGLIALRRTRAVLVKNLAGSLLKVAALAPLTPLRTTGLAIAFAAGAGLSAGLGVAILWRGLAPAARPAGPLRLLRRYASFSTGNYAGTVLGILPLSVVPILVLGLRGAREAAWFSLAFLLVGFLNFIPSTAAQVLFAEASRTDASLRQQARKALRVIYGLLLGPATVLLAGAPLVLGIFGPEYSAGATGALRALVVGTLFTGGTYLVDALLTARDRVGAYVLMNFANAGLVLAGVALGLRGGLSGAGAGWAAAQAASLGLGVLVLAATGLWRPAVSGHREPARRPVAASAPALAPPDPAYGGLDAEAIQ